VQANETQHNYEKKMKMLRDDLELRRKQEIHEIEERKNSHINELMKKHERAFAEIKNYYNDITHNNLDLIKTLKEDVAEMKKREAQNEKLMYEIAQENKRLSEPLTKALKEVEALRHAVANYDKDKLSLAQTKVRLPCCQRPGCKPGAVGKLLQSSSGSRSNSSSSLPWGPAICSRMRNGTDSSHHCCR